MTPQIRAALKWCIAVAILAAILPAVIFGAPRAGDGGGGDPWRNVIFDFQTLITGLLAVGAAYFTIRKMDETDSGQERRHRELVRLTLRGDERKFERTLNPQLEDLKSIVWFLENKRFNENDYPKKPGDPVWHMLTAEAPDMQDHVQDTLKILGRPQFQAGLDLFNGTCTWAIGSLADRCVELLPMLRKHIEANENPGTNDAAFYEATFDEGTGDRLALKLIAFKQSLEFVVLNLEEAQIEGIV